MQCGMGRAWYFVVGVGKDGGDDMRHEAAKVSVIWVEFGGVG